MQRIRVPGLRTRLSQLTSGPPPSLNPPLNPPPSPSLPQEVERIAMELSLVEKGKIYVKGIFDQKEALANKSG